MMAFDLTTEDMAVLEPARKQVHVAQSTGNNEWYTPPIFIEAARATMGTIDIDPASSAIANKNVKATKYFTEEDNGLLKTWHGNIWLNSPYSQPLISQFCEAVAYKYESGEISQACVLVNNGTETKWGQRLLSVANAVCFPSSRICFLRPDGNKKGTPLQGQAIIYMGIRVSEFAQSFEKFGICLPIARTKKKNEKEQLAFF
ncbi:hypothetical protein A6M27_10740 [Acidithiobacillus thiooxidans]|uniref:Adenine methyltransferase n=1 Tax=Acidithiobacillus thiooxidans TaxID=930 RepID=A0A1C2I764_ACITH|nr:DNA N-6-adenine-methyltransferase [Acidithiobacillus thiooxidans]OCX68702.1 hypothetical protein A6O24_19435 [Acidithiobacillus thiooxidans]OCX71832.1 hypothetical protein A6P07_11225 [Acidithiobacillus thiooxidans]OCX76808.1 hypothetical protein A6O26_20715 [Acidithiobacillus thiooxidans]OCX87152.1 hypothetical protein A6M27_10740 [Acidithiobacillus thiooxidans]OFC49623.1 hypothetical protein BAE47_04680 [Acidithiobacillus thiooxidans]